MAKFTKEIGRKRYNASYAADGIHYSLQYRIPVNILGRIIPKWVTMAEVTAGDQDFELEIQPILDNTVKLMFDRRKLVRKTRINPFTK